MLFVIFLLALSAQAASDLDSQDRGRVVLTYCHMVRDEEFASQHRLETQCSMRVGLFEGRVCVVDPNDEELWVDGTCKSLKRVLRVANTFCPKTTTPTDPTTTTTTAATTLAEPEVPELESSLIDEGLIAVGPAKSDEGPDSR